MHSLPVWIVDLEDEELAFLKRFVLSSGSLKEMANQYGVTYPTVRLRLDRLIKKIESKENGDLDPYINLIRQYVQEEKMAAETGKMLIAQYRKQVNGF